MRNMDETDIRSVTSPDALPYLDRLVAVYNAPFARQLGIEVQSISPEDVSLYLDIRPQHINSRGYLHGSVIFALADHTLAFCANMTEESVGYSVNIQYHRPVQEGRLISRSRLINSSKSFKTYDITVWCNDKLIASTVCTSFRLGDKK